MEYKGIRYSVGETVGAACRWTVSLTTGERVGEARNRQLAIIKAIKAVRVVKHPTDPCYGDRS
jgi:hypothetical protein